MCYSTVFLVSKLFLSFFKSNWFRIVWFVCWIQCGSWFLGHFLLLTPIQQWIEELEETENKNKELVKQKVNTFLACCYTNEWLVPCDMLHWEHLREFIWTFLCRRKRNFEIRNENKIDFDAMAWFGLSRSTIFGRNVAVDSYRYLQPRAVYQCK